MQVQRQLKKWEAQAFVAMLGIICVTAIALITHQALVMSGLVPVWLIVRVMDIEPEEETVNDEFTGI